VLEGEVEQLTEDLATVMAQGSARGSQNLTEEGVPPGDGVGAGQDGGPSGLEKQIEDLHGALDTVAAELLRRQAEQSEVTEKASKDAAAAKAAVGGLLSREEFEVRLQGLLPSADEVARRGVQQLAAELAELRERDSRAELEGLAARTRALEA
jgi:hypothetical protein